MALTKDFIKVIGNYTNKTSLYLYVTGYVGSYIISDSNDTQISGMADSIPYAIVPPNCTISGGTIFWGWLQEGGL